mmetsp:Transcript_96697/g.282663  ORF Transcript_96697/g.282663 Transcript_96697/m.282663 type:complete len:370 (-) Transcript_96697:49-1158(-)
MYLFLGLAGLARAALANDAFCMVQKNTQLNQVVLDAMEIPENVTDGLILAIEQLPMQLMLNATKEEMLKLNGDLLDSLHDPKYLASMYSGLKSFTAGLTNFSKALVSQAQQLMKASSNVTRGRTYFLLEHYSLLMDDVMAELAGSVVDTTRDILEAAPEGAFRNKTRVPREAMKNLTKAKVSEYITSTVLRPKTKKIFDQRGVFCTRFMSAMFKNSDLDESLGALVTQGFQEARDLLPEAGPAVLRKRAPDLEAPVMQLLNVSLDATYRSFRGVSLGYHMMNKAMTEVASTRLNCSLPPNVTAEDVAKAEAGQQATAAPDAAPVAELPPASAEQPKVAADETGHSGAVARGGHLAAAVALLAALQLGAA